MITTELRGHTTLEDPKQTTNDDLLETDLDSVLQLVFYGNRPLSGLVPQGDNDRTVTALNDVIRKTGGQRTMWSSESHYSDRPATTVVRVGHQKMLLIAGH